MFALFPGILNDAIHLHLEFKETLFDRLQRLRLVLVESTSMPFDGTGPAALKFAFAEPSSDVDSGDNFRISRYGVHDFRLRSRS